MRKFIVLMLILLLLPTLSGCWDAEEINELGFVLSVALDKADDGYKVTAQIAKPETYSKTPSGRSQTEKAKPFWVVSATGKSIFEAIRNMSNTAPRRIFWAHIKVIIIGEKLARSDIHEILDFFTRNPELRLRTLVAVTPGEASKILEVVPMMEKDPATDLERLIENRSLSGKGYRIMLKNFLEDYLDPNANPVASKIQLSKEEGSPALELNGAAVFRKGKMAGWLDGKNTRGLLWIKNDIKSSVMVINCPFDGQPITLEIKEGKTSFQSSIDNGIPYYQIKVKATGNLVEQGCATDFTDQKAIKALEGTLESAIRSDIQSTLTTAQNLELDFLGFNEVLHRQHKADWQQLSKNWPEAFSEAAFKIDVKANIPSLSVLAKPLEPNPRHTLEQK
ncbi:MAG TPA: Ger(x)C family spore germination protein [Syntrophomonadaceae bacterium]|nr:Ger(x)C family spore germination protein [Syntrophomonadaceae bacterium]